ncbi:MAG: Gfo/Idh/MocA family oxidoreductase [Anaerolineae bacterium]|nr:Gfo/Idh/MocA family oxidoreductase [Anaerolineae bacterium]
MSPVTAVMLGAGGRGYKAYGPYAPANPDELQFVAVAEPIDDRRDRFGDAHNIPPERRFKSWDDLLAQGQMADALFNCTMDQMHTASTLAALNAGYEVLLEKPMAHNLIDNVRLVQTAEQQGRLLQICHVLRYTTFFRKIREIVQSGRLGRIINIDHRENLIYWHMAHSFVRGNWRNEATSAPMILAKCCHDLDILTWILQRQVVRLGSFGSLTYFRPENAPEGAPLRCLDGCPAADDCKFYAPRIYGHDGSGFTLNAVTYEPTTAARMKALETSPYGRCVYHCDNDVVDHQTVTMEMSDATTVTLVMQGHGFEECRTMRYDGTKATMQARFGGQGGNKLTIRDHLSGATEYIDVEDSSASGHGGGDFGLIASFLRAMRGEPDDSLTSARASLESHLLAFAAEEARLNGSVIEMDNFRKRADTLAESIVH